MSPKENIMNFVTDVWDYIKIKRMRINEERKFHDPRRKAIYEQVTLTKNQERQIDKLYQKNYGKKISYIWHRHFTSFTGKFVAGYIPENIYIPEFEHFMNQYPAYVKVFSDKNILPVLAKSGGGINSQFLYKF